MKHDQWEYIRVNIPWKEYDEQMKRYGLKRWEAYHNSGSISGPFKTNVHFKRVIIKR